LREIYSIECSREREKTLKRARDRAHINDEFNLYANKLAALSTQTR